LFFIAELRSKRERELKELDLIELKNIINRILLKDQDFLSANSNLRFGFNQNFP